MSRKLDSLDVKILRGFAHDRQRYPFQSEIKKSFRAVARELDVDESTARNRMKKLRDVGFVKNWDIFPNPRLFGLRVADCRFEVQPESMKGDAISKIRLIQRVWSILSYLGDSMRVILYFEDDQSLQKQIELISRITNSEAAFYREIHFPTCNIVPSKHDWEIVRSIQKNQTKSYDEILRDTNLSFMTVKRRLARMIEGRTLFTLPCLEPRALSGAMIADLNIIFERSESKQQADGKIISYLDEYFLSAELGETERMTFVLLITNISKIREIVDWVERRDGIKFVRLDLIEEWIELNDTFGREVEKKLEQSRA
jgi:DNA-binding Lrp family transcriptional regulator